MPAERVCPRNCISLEREAYTGAWPQAPGIQASIGKKGGSMMQVSDDQVRGRSVIAADGQEIGEVGALLVDTSAWTIVALQIKLHKPVAEQLGAARGILRAAPLELPVRMVQSVGDAVLLSVPTLDLRQLLPDADDRHKEKT